jgi:Fe2+ transport system protein FeoA
MSSITLDALNAGERGKVTQVSGTSDIQRRLLEMGITPGTTVRLVRFAPMGDPLDIEVRGYHLSLRKNEARQVTLDRL